MKTSRKMIRVFVCSVLVLLLFGAVITENVVFSVFGKKISLNQFQTAPRMLYIAVQSIDSAVKDQ